MIQPLFTLVQATARYRNSRSTWGSSLDKLLLAHPQNNVSWSWVSPPGVAGTTRHPKIDFYLVVQTLLSATEGEGRGGMTVAGCPLAGVSPGACVHSATQHAHDRKKLGVFATIGNILAYTNHTTPPQRWTA